MSEETDRAWALMEGMETCLLSTLDEGEIRSRPMVPHVDRETRTVRFLTDAESHKEADIARHPNVGLVFADPDGRRWLSATGRATIGRDRAAVRELWSTEAAAWWSDPDNPDVHLLTVSLNDAQYWERPGGAVTGLKLFAASLGNARPELGESAKVDLSGKPPATPE